MAASVNSNICDASPWAASTAYTVGDRVENDTGKVYNCVTSGTSAGSGGPTGTGSGISDGSCEWDYVVTRDYTSLSNWQGSEQVNLQTADEVHTATCYRGQDGGMDDVLDLSGWNPDATRYCILTVASVDRHDGTPQSGFYVKASNGTTSDSPVIDLNQDYTRAEWLDVENTSTDASSHAIDSRLHHGIELDYCIGKCQDGSAFRLRGDGTGGGGWEVEARNCLAWGGSIGFGESGSSRQRWRTYNCDAVNCGTGFLGGNTNQPTAVNCVGYNSTTADFNGSFSAGSDYNASEDTSAPGSNSVNGVDSSDFADAANDDYHVSGTGSALYNAGTDTSGDGVTDDIDGDSRSSTYDIGFDEYVAAGGATVDLSGSPASTTASCVAPAVVRGSIANSPASADATSAAPAPTPVKGSLAVTPAVATGVASAPAPTVGLSANIVTPSGAAGTGTAVAPTVQHGSQTISPSLADALGLAVAPQIRFGSLSITPAIAAASASALAPTAVRGSITSAPGQATASAAAVAPSVQFGSLTASVDVASATAYALIVPLTSEPDRRGRHRGFLLNVNRLMGL